MISFSRSPFTSDVMSHHWHQYLYDTKEVLLNSIENEKFFYCSDLVVNGCFFDFSPSQVGNIFQKKSCSLSLKTRLKT